MPFLNNLDENQNFKFSENEILSFLDLRLKNGDRIGIPYSYISQINYSTTGSIILTVNKIKIIIEGYNLEEIYSNLLRQSCLFIQERGEKYSDSESKSPYIISIKTEDD